LGSTATPWGSSPTAIVLITALVLVRITDTVSAPGLTTQTKRPSAERAIGLE
jgi:hypothetical protein